MALPVPNPNNGFVKIPSIDANQISIRPDPPSTNPVKLSNVNLSSRLEPNCEKIWLNNRKRIEIDERNRTINIGLDLKIETTNLSIIKKLEKKMARKPPLDPVKIIPKKIMIVIKKVRNEMIEKLLNCFRERCRLYKKAGAKSATI